MKGGSCCRRFKRLNWFRPRHGQQALPDERRTHARFKPVNRRENHPVKKTHCADVKRPFLQETKIEPPREVADKIVIAQFHNLKTSLLQLRPQFRFCVTPEMAKIPVNRRVNLRSRRDEQAERPLLSSKFFAVDFQLALILVN